VNCNSESNSVLMHNERLCFTVTLYASSPPACFSGGSDSYNNVNRWRWTMLTMMTTMTNQRDACAAQRSGLTCSNGQQACLMTAQRIHSPVLSSSSSSSRGGSRSRDWGGNSGSEARAYNVMGLRAVPPEGSRDRAPNWGIRGPSPPSEAERFFCVVICLK